MATGRRDEQRLLRRRRHAVAGRGAALLERCHAGRQRHAHRPDADAARRAGCSRHVVTALVRRLGLAQRCAHRRRCRRQRGRGGRRRCGAARRGLPVARHLGRDLRRHRRPACQPRARRSHLLPRTAEHLAPDGGDAVGQQRAELVVRHHRHDTGRRAGGLACRRCSPQCAAVPALPVGRAHAACRPGVQRQLPRPDARPWPRRPELRRDRRRGLRVRRRPGRASRGRQRPAAPAGHRRRRAVRRVAATAGRHAGRGR